MKTTEYFSFIAVLIYLSSCTVDDKSDSGCDYDEGFRIKIFEGEMTVPSKYILNNSVENYHVFEANYPENESKATIVAGLTGNLSEFTNRGSDRIDEEFSSFMQGDIKVQLSRPKKGTPFHTTMEFAVFSNDVETMYVVDPEKCVWREILDSYKVVTE